MADVADKIVKASSLKLVYDELKSSIETATSDEINEYIGLTSASLDNAILDVLKLG